MRQINVSGCQSPVCRWSNEPRTFWQEAVGEDVYEDTTYICICGAPLTSYEPVVNEPTSTPVIDVVVPIEPVTPDAPVEDTGTPS